MISGSIPPLNDGNTAPEDRNQPLEAIAVQAAHSRSKRALAQFTLDVSAAPTSANQDVTLVVRPGPFPIRVFRSGSPPGDLAVNLDVTGFMNEQGAGAHVKVSVDGRSDPPAQHLERAEGVHP
jgi:hypothetical protein